MTKSKEKKANSDGLNFIERFVAKMVIRKIMKKLETMNKSTKTSLGGWLQLVAGVATALALLLDGDPQTIPDVDDIWVALAALGVTVPGWIIGLFARDNDVTSEKAGAK